MHSWPDSGDEQTHSLSHRLDKRVPLVANHRVVLHRVLIGAGLGAMLLTIIVGTYSLIA